MASGNSVKVGNRVTTLGTGRAKNNFRLELLSSHSPRLCLLERPTPWLKLCATPTNAHLNLKPGINVGPVHFNGQDRLQCILRQCIRPETGPCLLRTPITASGSTKFGFGIGYCYNELWPRSYAEPNIPFIVSLSLVVTSIYKLLRPSFMSL